ncbi:MAG: hypothetical protein J5643_00775 [Lachnospiraceae bacterium]|nr:hypothetical protein [Lachnospiraceae bacterium]
MKVNLLNCEDYVNSDVLPFKNDVFEDFDLQPILETMSKNDKYVYQACRNIMLSPSGDRKNILHRQAAIQEALANKKHIFQLYITISETFTDIINQRDRMKKESNSTLPAVRVVNSIDTLNILFTGLENLKKVIIDANNQFEDGIFRDFFMHFLKEYDDDFIAMMTQKRDELREIQMGGEVKISGRIGRGMKCDRLLVNSITKVAAKRKFERWDSLFGTKLKKNEVRISYDNIHLNQDCLDLQNTALLHVASCFEDFNKEISKLFDTLRAQIAFFYGCCNLHTHMTGMAFRLCFPEIEERYHAIEADCLYDLVLAIRTLKRPMDNSFKSNDTLLYLITGVNRGGKTSFLRSIGTAQIMAQCGMFVPCKTMKTSVFRGIFTHFVRNEDETLNSGRLEEELSRLNRIIDTMNPGSMIFLNESFATTSEKEGAAMAEDIIRALNDNQVTVFFVTHIYAFAKKAFAEKYPRTKFFETEQNERNERTFRIIEGEPTQTGYAMELYRKTIGIGG